MDRLASLVFIVSFLFMSASVMDRIRADLCEDGLGKCDNCDQRCKTKHGPSSQSKCAIFAGVPLCTCYYQCGRPPSPPPPKTCDGGAGLCSEQCPDNCCDTNCSKKYKGGHGFCNALGSTRLCQCQYPC